MWGATNGADDCRCYVGSFNSRTPCGVRLPQHPPPRLANSVSIHAPRVGCDPPRWLSGRGCSRFNSRTPCGVRRALSRNGNYLRKFQFTHPVWGATAREPREGDGADVSIHAPRVGCDLRGLTNYPVPEVSIHAPRVGCDDIPGGRALDVSSFNSRTPCGVRLDKYLQYTSRTLFQFTHPVWGATDALSSQFSLSNVSIHAPRVGCDIVI